MRIRKVRIADKVEYVESGDGFERKVTGERVIPAHLTMHALHFGVKEELVESSIFSEIAENLDEFNSLKLVYMACEGANPGFHKAFPFETFATHIVGDMNEVLYIARSLLIDALPDTESEYIQSLEEATKEDDSEKK